MRKVATGLSALALAVGLQIAAPLPAQAYTTDCGTWEGPYANALRPTQSKVCADYRLQPDGVGFFVASDEYIVDHAADCPPNILENCFNLTETWVENASHITKWNTFSGDIDGLGCSDGWCHRTWNYSGEVAVNTNDAYVKVWGTLRTACAANPTAVCSHTVVATVHLTR